MGVISRNNPQFGIWVDNDGSDEHYHPIPKPCLDVRIEAEAKAKQVHPCITYYVDSELLKRGIIKKVGDIVKINSNLMMIANHYGKKNQTIKAAEELAELIQALSKGKRQNILEEMADVHVMIEQMMYFYDISPAEVQAVADIKTERQVKRIKDENGGD